MAQQALVEGLQKKATSAVGAGMMGNNSNVSKAVEGPLKWLGPKGKNGGVSKKKDASGDKVFLSDDGKRKFRLDVNNSHGDKPHVHMQIKNPNGTWSDATPVHRIYLWEGGQ